MNTIFFLIFACILLIASGCRNILTYTYVSGKTETHPRQSKVVDTQTLSCSHVDLKVLLNYTHRYAKHHHLEITESDFSVLPTNLFFSGFSDFQSLTLKNLQIKNISKEAFEDFARLQELDLSDNELVTVPEAVLDLASLHTLDLSNNKIENIDQVDFSKLLNLKFFYLKENNLKRVTSEVFDSFKALYELDLSGNPLQELKYITSSTLKRLVAKNTNLLAVGLKNSVDLVDLSNGEFYDLFRFADLFATRVILANSSITSLADTPKNVEYLDLSRNNLTEPGSWKQSFVKHLDLSFNKIVELKFRAFSYQDHLVSLYLNNNNLEVLHRQSIQNCISLKILDLSSNQLSYIHSDAFNLVPRLATLDLSSNKLKALNLMMLPHQSAIKSLIISNNKIAGLNMVLFKTVFSNLQTVALNNNLWFCKNLKQVLDTLILEHVHVTDASSHNVKNNLNGISCKQ